MYYVDIKDILVVFLFLIFSSVLNTAFSNGKDLSQQCKRLIDKATKKGEIQVLITFNVPFTPEGKLNEEQIKEQRAKILEIKKEFKESISSSKGNIKILKKYGNIIPILLVRANATAIFEICNNPLVKFIEENKESLPLEEE